MREVLSQYPPIELKKPVGSDIEISQSVTPIHISEIARNAGILDEELELYGSTKAKVSLNVKDRLANEENGNYVLVTAINPTKYGEGKSTVTLGLAQALTAHLGLKSFACIRQPSLGPTFGVKGGAAGGGYSQVVPMEEFNLHLTGDIHAVTSAHNLLSAAIDTRMFHEAGLKDESLWKKLTKNGKHFSNVMLKRVQKLGIDKTDPSTFTPEEQSRFARLNINPDTITWNRVLDVCDRHLRGVTVGEGSAEKGRTRKTGFDISVASEVMAILALTTSLTDMRDRLGRMVIGLDYAGTPVTADDLGVGGALTILMREAIKPNLMQSIERTPVFVHAGPFANIATGTSSVLADQIALKLCSGEDGFVVTEGGFGADMGMEKFVNIKCRNSGLLPHCSVIVVTVRALKYHGEGQEDEDPLVVLRRGCENMKKHIENAKKLGVTPVVCINKFITDSEEEFEIIKQEAAEGGVFDCVVSNHWEEGGRGAVDLAESVRGACQHTRQARAASPSSEHQFLYNNEDSIKSKIETICKEVYGAGSVSYSDEFEQKCASYTELGYNNLPICMAKTQYSLSSDPNLLGRPEGFDIHVRDIRSSVGAGFLYPLLGTIQTIPGLPVRPGFFDMDLDEDGNVMGMF
jgi:formyltetrahydrofolate synthetase